MNIVHKILAVDPEIIKLPDNSNNDPVTGDKGDWTTVDLSNVMSFLDSIIKIALDLAIIVGVIMILYSAFTYATALERSPRRRQPRKLLSGHLWARS